MKFTTIFTLASLLVVLITGQAQATNPQLTTTLELANYKYMMSANLMNNEGSPPPRGNGRRGFADHSKNNRNPDYDKLFRRGSGR